MIGESLGPVLLIELLYEALFFIATTNNKALPYGADISFRVMPTLTRSNLLFRLFFH